MRGGIAAEVALVAGLRRLGLAEAPPAPPSFVDGMGRWLGWTDAIRLAGALNTAPAAATPTAAAAVELARLRAALARTAEALARAIDGDDEIDGDRAGDADVAAQRRRHRALQQRMEDAITPLRAQARQALAGRSTALDRLVAVDAVLAEALADREAVVLAGVPPLLQRRFDRLKQAAEAEEQAAAPAAAWFARFRGDLRGLLHAELELRLQPVRGLLDALAAAAPEAAA